ncbi:MAG: YciI family protein [Inhella sp.]
MRHLLHALALSLPLLASAQTAAQTAPAPSYDEALAQRVGANDNGMRAYVLVILKSSGTPVPKGEARDAMFKGHFANMKRLADAGVLALAGPLDGVDGWRGLFVLAVPDIETAKQHVATDPVIAQGEMVAEYHRYFGSAALMLVNEHHAKVAKKPF